MWTDLVTMQCWILFPGFLEVGGGESQLWMDANDAKSLLNYGDLDTKRSLEIFQNSNKSGHNLINWDLNKW